MGYVGRTDAEMERTFKLAILEHRYQVRILSTVTSGQKEAHAMPSPLTVSNGEKRYEEFSVDEMAAILYLCFDH